MAAARDLYPDARVDVDLPVDDSRLRAHADGRSWRRISAVVFTATAASWYLSIDRMLVVSLVLTTLSVACCAVTYLDTRRRPRHRVPWDRWGHDRGLAHVSKPPFAGSGLGVLEPQLERRWHGLHHGRIGNGDTVVDAWIGSTDWDSGDARHLLLPDVATLALAFVGDSDIDGGMRSATIVAIDLGADVGRWFPASTLVSFLDPADGIPTGWSNPKVIADDEQRFESIRLDETREIRVRGDHDRWHQLFDAELVDLLTITPAQWIQRGRWLVLLDSHSDPRRVDAMAVDTLVGVAPAIVSRFRAVAAGAAREVARASR